jgi:hypothetical protein
MYCFGLRLWLCLRVPLWVLFHVHVLTLWDGRVGYLRPPKDYVDKRTAEGKTKREIIRCLKRYIARELYPILTCSLPRDRSPISVP